MTFKTDILIAAPAAVLLVLVLNAGFNPVFAWGLGLFVYLMTLLMHALFFSTRLPRVGSASGASGAGGFGDPLEPPLLPSEDHTDMVTFEQVTLGED